MSNTSTNSNVIEKTFAKEVVETIDSFLYRNSRAKFKTIIEAAEGLKTVWEKLEFIDKGEDPFDFQTDGWERCTRHTGLEFQVSGIKTLNRIIKGELTGSSAEEHLHTANAMFNQSNSAALNVV